MIELLSNGKGSIDFAKNLLDNLTNPPSPSGEADLTGMDSSEVPDLPTPSSDLAPYMESDELPTWCKCGMCKPMKVQKENNCCGLRNCITSYELFHTQCLNRDVLILGIRNRCDFRGDEPSFGMQDYRWAAYRHYILWRFGKMGRGNRKACPSCVYIAIRRAYPSASGQYMGFKSS